MSFEGGEGLEELFYFGGTRGLVEYVCYSFLCVERFGLYIGKYRYRVRF